MRRDRGMLRAVSPYRQAAALGLAVGALVSAGVMAPAAAQETVFVGKGNPRDVILDLSALDRLGPPPKAARVHLSNPQADAATGPVVLTPPGEKIGEKPGQKPEQKTVKRKRSDEESPKAQAELAEPRAPTRVIPKPPPAMAETPAPQPAPAAPPSRSAAAAPAAPQTPLAPDSRTSTSTPAQTVQTNPRPLPLPESSPPPATTPSKSAAASPARAAPAAPPPAKAAEPPPATTASKTTAAAPAQVAQAAPPPATASSGSKTASPAQAASPASAAAEPPTPPPLPASKVAAGKPPQLAERSATPAAPPAAAPAPAPRAASAESKPAASAPATQLAAKPPTIPNAAGGSLGKALSVNFAGGGIDLTDQAKGELNKVVATLKKSDDLRVQLIAYAAGSEAEASQARRLSLSRALAVRGYLFDQGVGASRMDVRALGNKLEDNGPADRVDLVVVGK
ncbi:MAG: OmpA family protein [Alphaproteobacteria bacterium]